MTPDEKTEVARIVRRIEERRRDGEDDAVGVAAMHCRAAIVALGSVATEGAASARRGLSFAVRALLEEKKKRGQAVDRRRDSGDVLGTNEGDSR